jgi:purine-binding chemotaxis protein CheW
MAELITGYGVDREDLALEHIEETFTQYLTFWVAKKTYAVGILDVNEIIEVSEMTDVPMMPDFIRGVINLRGSAVPVIDLAARLSRGQSDITKRSCIVLVEINRPDGMRQPIGMLVDAVNEIVEIEQAHIKPAPNMGKGVKTDFIHAMGKVDDIFIILLDIDHVLSHEQIDQIEQLTEFQDAMASSEANATDSE